MLQAPKLQRRIAVGSLKKMVHVRNAVKAKVERNFRNQHLRARQQIFGACHFDGIAVGYDGRAEIFAELALDVGIAVRNGLRQLAEVFLEIGRIMQGNDEVFQPRRVSVVRLGEVGLQALADEPCDHGLADHDVCVRRLIHRFLNIQAGSFDLRKGRSGDGKTQRRRISQYLRQQRRFKNLCDPLKKRRFGHEIDVEKRLVLAA